MKKILTGVLFLAIIALSCNQPQKETQKNEPVVSDSLKLISGGNLIKSEAPDAATKFEQGYALPHSDKGNEQSPINILTASTTKANTKKVTLKFNIEINAVENLGHTVQIDFKEGSTTIKDGQTYLAKQFHFHTPSEHLMDGVTYPMELHLVNVLNDSNMKTKPQYMVVGILFKMGKANKFIDQFINAIPKEEHQKEAIQSGKVVLEDLFRDIPKSEDVTYFNYKGSLTTPPFSETVNWLVGKYILEASPEQIAAIEKIEGDNARHIQDLKDRKVVSLKQK
ncbi:MAG: carbonic anhydrase family protein [Bacteroidota bacterium]